jgi:glycosyltransferase involved in cell wall biosynthesis
MTHKDPQRCSVAVVVPTRNSERTIAACLQSIRRQTYPCITVVVDNSSGDGTVSIAQRWADSVFQAGPERSAQRNYGASLTDTDVLGFVDSDMVLTPEVVEQVVSAIACGAGAVIVPEVTVGEGFWAEVRAFERSFYSGADNIEAARFYRRDVFQVTGGFDESLTGPEDIDLTVEARRVTSVVRVGAVIYHDEGRVEFVAACRKKAFYGPGMRRYVAKRGFGAVRSFADRPWLRHPARLVSARGAGLMALKVGETLAVCWVLVRGEANSKLMRMKWTRSSRAQTGPSRGC